MDTALHWILWVATVIWIGGVVIGALAGDIAMRDERGRLRPVPAVMAVTLGIFVVALIAGLLT